MSSSKLRVLVQNSILAALYVTITLVFAPISYGPVQFRVSEMLIMLPFFNKKWVPGIVVGTIIANMFSPLGLIDVIFGTLATLISVVLMTKTKNVIIGILIPSVVNGIIIGIELNFMFNMPLVATMIYVALGELAVLVVGAIVFKSVIKNKTINELIEG